MNNRPRRISTLLAAIALALPVGQALAADPAPPSPASLARVPADARHVMDRMGWSSQKPQRLAIQRDEEAIVSWKRRGWPRIKKVA